MKRSPLLIGVGGAICYVAATCFYAARTGIAFEPIVGILFFIPLLVLTYWGLGFAVRRFKLAQSKAIFVRVGFWLIPVIWELWNGYVSGTTKVMFERLVMKPMPASVQQFEWTGGVGIDGSYNFSFQMDPTDTKNLIRYLRLEIDTNLVSWADSDLQEVISSKVSWARLPLKTLENPVFYSRRTPWWVELVTDASNRQVYMFR